MRKILLTIFALIAITARAGDCGFEASEYPSRQPRIYLSGTFTNSVLAVRVYPVALYGSGESWMVIKPGKEEAISYTPEATYIEVTHQPIVIQDGKKWIIRFKVE